MDTSGPTSLTKVVHPGIQSDRLPSGQKNWV
jgi:hypothetical protein